MACADAPQLSAYFDAELPAREAATVAAHLEECASCRAHLSSLSAQRARLRGVSESLSASRALATRVRSALGAEEAARAARRGRRREFWLGSLGGALLGACAAALVFVATPLLRTDVLGELATAHLTALSRGALIEMPSSDHHTLKPWFAGRSDVAPVVADFAADGFGLVGGRVQRVGGARVAVLVYRHGAHLLEVFSWPAAGPVPPARTVRGYHLLSWQVGDVRSCFVGDAEWPELQRLAQLLEQRANLEAAPR